MVSIITTVQITSTPGMMLTPIFTPSMPPSSRADMKRVPVPPARTGRTRLPPRDRVPPSIMGCSRPYILAVNASMILVDTILPTTAPRRPVRAAPV